MVPQLANSEGKVLALRLEPSNKDGKALALKLGPSYGCFPKYSKTPRELRRENTSIAAKVWPELIERWDSSDGVSNFFNTMDKGGYDI
jgi:hypothetical protein